MLSRMLLQLFNLYRGLLTHYPLQDLLILLMQSLVRHLSLIPLDLAHAEGLLRNVGCRSHGVVGWHVEHFGWAAGIELGCLLFVRTLSVHDCFYLVEEAFVLSLNICVPIFF